MPPAPSSPEPTDLRALREGLLEQAPLLIAAFHLPDLAPLYLNPAGRRHLAPQDADPAALFPLPALLGLGSLDRFRREILPQLLGLGRWSGQLELRDTRGDVFPTRVALATLSPPSGLGVHGLALFGQLPSADADTAAGPTGEEMLHTLLESTPDQIVVKDAHGRYLRLSRAHAAHLHLADPAAAIGKTDFDFLAVEDAARFFSAELQIQATGQPTLEVEDKSVYADGSVLWTSTSRFPFYDRAGRLRGTVTVAHDITRRRVAEESLRESEVVFRSIFEGSNDAIILYIDERFYDCNPGTLAMFGCAKEQFIGRTTAEISPPTQPDGRSSALAAREYVATARREGYCRFDWVHRRHDGTDFPAEVLLASFDFGGRRILQSTIRDITERKRAEAARREMELQLQLAQKLESVGRLAAGVAHEINTPSQFVADNVRFLVAAFGQLDRVLASHRAALTALAAHPEHAAVLAAVHAAEEENELGFLLGEIPRTLDQSIEGLSRITKIVASLKEFSHPGEKALRLADLNRAIETTIAVSRHEWKYVATVTTALDPDLGPVPCVIDEFNQAILNLIVNAAQAIGEANPARGRTLGCITIRTHAEGDWAVVEVADDGTGIPPEVRSRIFEPFFTTKAPGKGTGQGLYLVRNVVVGTHHGRLDYTTECGRGTTFRLALPRTPPA